MGHSFCYTLGGQFQILELQSLVDQSFDEMSVMPLRILVMTLSTIALTDRAGRVVSFVTRFRWVMLHIPPITMT